MNATANLLVVNGNYELAVGEYGRHGHHVVHVRPGADPEGVAHREHDQGNVPTQRRGIHLHGHARAPPCPCNGGEDVKVDFAGSGESAGSKVQIGALTVTATGGGGLTTTAATTTQQTTTTTVTTTTPPKAAQKLAGKVGPGARITLTRSAKAGKTTVAVSDLSAKDNFHLMGPGVNKKTGVAFMGKVSWSLSLKKGSYSNTS